MGKVSVRIAHPVKLDGGVYMPGVHEIESEIADELKALGAVDEAPADAEPADALEAITLTADEIDAQVAGRAKVIAETIVAAAVEQAVTELARERDDAVDRAKAAEDRLAAIEAEAKERAKEDADPAGRAEKAPKKGAAAKG